MTPRRPFFCARTKNGTGKMSRELKITLSDEQCDALAVEAKQNGLKFFDHCRAKLAAGLESAPLERAPVAKPVQSTAMKPAGAQPDRLDRLEAMMLQLADAVQGGALAKPVPEPVEYHGPEIDVADVIGDALGEA